MSNILKGILNEGAYQDGVRDGMQGQANPRASSIYGPESSEYQRGYEDGLVKGKDQKQVNIDSYNAKLAPYKDIPTEELKQMLRNIRKRSDEIQAIFNKYKGASLFGGDAPPNTEELRAEGKKNNEAWQAIHQELFQRGLSQEQRLSEDADKSWEQAYKILQANDGEPDTSKGALTFQKQLAMLAKSSKIFDRYELTQFLRDYKAFQYYNAVRNLIPQAPTLDQMEQFAQQSQIQQTNFQQQQEIGHLQHNLNVQQLVQRHELEAQDQKDLLTFDVQARLAIQKIKQEQELDAKERLVAIQREIEDRNERKEIRDHELKLAQAGYDHDINVINATAEGEYKKAKLEADYQIQIKQLENIDNAGERQNKLDQINTMKEKELAIINAETNAKIRAMEAGTAASRAESDLRIRESFMDEFKPIWGSLIQRASQVGKTLGQSIGAVTSALSRLGSVVMPKAVEEGITGRKVDSKGRTQIQWLNLVNKKFPDAQLIQAKMIDGPCYAILPDGRKFSWKPAEQAVTEGQDIDVNVVVGKLYDIIDHAEDSIKNADYDRQAQYATTVRDRAQKALEMIKQGGNTPEAADAAFRYFQSGEQVMAEGLDHSKRQQLIKFLAKKMGWEHSYLELASDANLISWYKKVQAGKDPMKENKSGEADYGDDYQAMVQRVGQKAKEQEKKKPVDIQALARRLNQPEKKSNILKGIEENLGTPYPSTYEEENKPFKKKGAYRITAMTSESKKK